MIAAIGVSALTMTAGAAIYNGRLATPKTGKAGLAVQHKTAATSDNRLPGKATIRRVTAGNLDNRNLKLLYKEDFAKFNHGTEDSPELFYTGYCMIPDEMTAQPGWSGAGIYEAGGILGLCIPGVDDIQGGGVINTPITNMCGKIIVKFRAKALQTDGVMFVNLCLGGIENPEPAAQFEMINKWEKNVWKDYAFEIIDPYSDADGFVQINGATFNGKGFLIDDIEIYRDMDYVSSPRTVRTSNFKTDGFTATWDSVPAADDYLVTLIEETQLGTEKIKGSADFNNIDTTGAFKAEDAPEGWGISLNGEIQTTADKGANNTPAVVLSDDKDMIILPITGGTFTEASFFMRSWGENKQTDAGYIVIEVLNPSTGNWQRYAFMSAGAVSSEEGYVVSTKEIEDQYGAAYPFKDLYTGVRIHLESNKGVPLAIDDVKFETNPARERKNIKEDMPVSGTSYTFTGLDPEKEHYVSVKGHSSLATAEASNPFHAFGISDVTELRAEDLDPRGGVTAVWDRVPRATDYEVSAYNAKTIPADTENYKILADDFSKVVVRNPVTDPLFLGNENSLMSLDEYTAMPGWTGRGNIVAKGMLGCIADPLGLFELYSPEITLSNNQGQYTVALKVYAEKGTQFVVQGTGVYQVAQFPDTGLYEMEVALDNGQDHDQLMFYTVSGEMFLIDNIEVRQNLKKDDLLYSLIEKVTTPDTDYRFSIEPEEGMKYGLQVRAMQTIFNKTCASRLTPMNIIDFFGEEGVETINASEITFRAEASQGEILVKAGNREVTVYDMMGRVLAKVAASQEKAVTLPAGVYAVSDGKAAAKVCVR